MAESYSVAAQLSVTDNGFVSTMNKAQGAMKGFDSGTSSATKTIGSFAAGMGVFKVAAAAVNILTNSMDAAITRFDTMQRYPKVMSALGYSADESSSSVNRLADGIDGLPTKLDDVASTAQQMTAITGNLDKSTDATIALNNAMLASGASTNDAARGLQQYVQMLSTGTVDLQSWKTLQETMPIGLQKTAEAMGFVGETAQRDLYAALKDGQITFKEFQNQLIELGTGTGELATLAKVNSEGIATSFGNLRNSAAKGLAGTIEAFDSLSKELTGKSIAANLDGLKVGVNGAFKMINSAISSATPFLKVFQSGVKTTIAVIRPLAPGILAMTAAYGGLVVIRKVNDYMQAQAAVMGVLKASGAAFTVTLNAKTAATTADAVATHLNSAAHADQMVAVKLSTALMGVLTGATSASAVATGIASAAVTAFSAAVKVALGPVGLIIGGIGLLTTAGAMLWKWLNKETDASKKLNAEQEKLAGSIDEVTQATESASKSRTEEIGTIETNAEAYKQLVDRIGELQSIEHKSKAQKKELSDSIEQLNGSMEGLNLMYDEESNLLSMTTDQMKQRIDVYKQQETAAEAQEAILEITKEQLEVEKKLGETNALREEWNQKLEDGKVKAKEHKEALAELDEQETKLKDTLAGLKTEQQSTQETMTAANEAIAAAVESGATRQIISYQTLSQEQQSAVDAMKDTYQSYEQQATNMFDVLSDKQEVSVAQMAANLQENQRVMSQWADNIATLANRGIDEGLLNKMRDMGPEGAGYVAAMVSASDEELQNLSTAFAKGGQTASGSLAKAFDTENNGVTTAINGMVMNAQTSLMSAIQAADFKSLGADVGAGAAQGIEASAGDAQVASEAMAQKVDQGFAKQLGIQSPSRVFDGHGKDVGAGLTQGIKGSESNVNSAMDGMVKVITTKGTQMVSQAKQISGQIPQAFSGLPAQMQSVGSYAMQGLAQGIQGSSGAALAAARSVANSVSSTIRDALKVKSPSRVTMEIGGYVGEGLAIGILNKVRQVKTAAGQYSDAIRSAIDFSVPEYDFAFSGNANLQANVQGNIDAPARRPINVTVVSELDGREIARVTAPDVEKEIAGRNDILKRVRGQ